jgi:hypothetical protein
MPDDIHETKVEAGGADVCANRFTVSRVGASQPGNIDYRKGIIRDVTSVQLFQEKAPRSIQSQVSLIRSARPAVMGCFPGSKGNN